VMGPFTIGVKNEKVFQKHFEGYFLQICTWNKFKKIWIVQDKIIHAMVVIFHVCIIVHEYFDLQMIRKKRLKWVLKIN
jgi:hypothetical protein